MNTLDINSNPLLAEFDLPPFSKIKPEHIKPAVEHLIQLCRDNVEKVVNQSTPYTFESVCEALALYDDRLSRVWSPISHLNSVKNSPELREAYEACLPLLSEYGTWVGQHEGLYQAYVAIKNSPEFEQLSIAQQSSITQSLRDFELSGIGLEKSKQVRYGEIVARLSDLSAQFSNHVLDATMAWSKLVTDVSELAGLPESAIAAAKERAEAKSQTGYLLTLDMPSYLPVMMYADKESLRSEMYFAYVTRASDQGPHAGQFDNSECIKEITSLRHELAVLLGFDNYAQKSLATKMAESPEQVLNFLDQLALKAKPQGEKELATLTEFAKKHFDVEMLNAWDIPYYSEKQKQHLFSINDEELRPYFPENRVLSGLFEVLKRLFGIEAKKRKGVDTWHEEVTFYDLFDEKGDLRGSFYLDLYAREHKRGGAWMDDCVGKLKLHNLPLQKPVAYLTCNFNRPVAGKPALFTHDEVITLFHEFGHGIHHMLTQIDVVGVAGINGVPWDAVELPSQFLENWCWEEEALAFISGHVDTNEPLPKVMLDKMLEAKNYQAAMFILRQLEFGLFDFQLHQKDNLTQVVDVLEILKGVKAKVAVIKSPEFNRFAHSFSHIFAGGYAAGYYSYLWAEVLSADAFSRFEEEGIFNEVTGRDFLNQILSKGGSEPPMTLFKRFRGREPDISALIRHYGISA
ncbi:oligopeptidase A [Thorsellia kenyensis]|uniref:oligopeptidase A n=1 Tax=Thorsellia kenyensis TaxID=1549888 RepID=A0ABV6CDH2_9GAMM